jgi:iron complex transport system substrate-binding protein
MRIASLLSSATEIVYELGLGDRLVAISHECDWPPEAMGLPRLSRSRFDPEGMDSGEIDAAVRRSMEEFGSVYEVDAEGLARARPDLVLTQAVCEVCAVPTGSVEAAVAELPFATTVLSLDAHTLEGILHTVRQVADAAGEARRGEEAVERLRGRVERVRGAVAGAPRPRVLALEWLDPPFAPGHWVPEMIEAAGGDNLLGVAGGHSEPVPWEDLKGTYPDRLLLMPCGYDLRQARVDAEQNRERLQPVAGAAIRRGQAWLCHGSNFSRSGPRVVDGVEALAHILHPDRFPDAPPAGRVERWQPAGA